MISYNGAIKAWQLTADKPFTSTSAARLYQIVHDLDRQFEKYFLLGHCLEQMQDTEFSVVSTDYLVASSAKPSA